MTEPVTEDGIESAWNACKYRGYCSRLHVENADVMVERDRLHAEVERLRAELARLTTLRPASEWRDDDGDVLWWRLPVEEPPYVGSPMEYGWRDDYYTHFSPLPDWVSQVLPEGTNPRKDGRWDNP
jgi:hypothetical protein